MGLFKKSPRLSPSPIAPITRKSNFLEPPNLPGLLRTRFVATLANGHRVAYWVGAGEQVVSQYEYEFETQDRFLSLDADKEIAFAMGLTDDFNIPIFTMTDGTSSRISLAWDPPLARSEEPVQERILREFDLSEVPTATIYGILQKGLSIWTLTFTDYAIYALSETGQQSKRIPWENLVEIRWNGFDLGLGEVKPSDTEYTSLHEFFHIRFAHTWKAFVVLLEEAWLTKGIIKKVSFNATGNRELSYFLISVHDRLFGQYLPVTSHDLYRELQTEGKVPEIEKWLGVQRNEFRVERVKNEA